MDYNIRPPGSDFQLMTFSKLFNLSFPACKLRITIGPTSKVVTRAR